MSAHVGKGVGVGFYAQRKGRPRGRTYLRVALRPDPGELPVLAKRIDGTDIVKGGNRGPNVARMRRAYGDRAAPCRHRVGTVSERASVYPIRNRTRTGRGLTFSLLPACRTIPTGSFVVPGDNQPCNYKGMNPHVLPTDPTLWEALLSPGPWREQTLRGGSSCRAPAVKAWGTSGQKCLSWPKPRCSGGVPRMLGR